MTNGIDLGNRFGQVCVLDQEGTLIEEGRLKTTPDAFGQRFQQCAPSRIAIETGTHSPWVAALLKELGHDAIVANPRKLRMIFRSDSKNDRFDAEQLARVTRMDPRLLSPIQHRGQEARADLALLRARDALVTSRTQLVNHVRGCVKSFGVRLDACSTRTFARRAAPQIPKELRQALVPVLRCLEALTARTVAFDKRVERICAEQYRETVLLRQVDGVGALTSLTFVLTLEDPHRFARRAVGAYLGIRPRQRQSGERDPKLRITKAGDHELRRLLVQCAQYILGPFGKDSDLRRFGLALAQRCGTSAKRRAVVAVARKLGVLQHRSWLTGEVYEPLRNAGRRAKGIAHSA